MKKSSMRRFAIGAARSEMRRAEYSTERMTPEAALRILDDLARKDRHSEASIWYLNASDNQIKLFKREWRKYWYHYV